jgi:hypothetical protein
MAATIPPEGSSGFDCSGPALFYKHIECAGDCSDPVTPDYPAKIFLTLTGLCDGGAQTLSPGLLRAVLRRTLAIAPTL